MWKESFLLLTWFFCWLAVYRVWIVTNMPIIRVLSTQDRYLFDFLFKQSTNMISVWPVGCNALVIAAWVWTNCSSLTLRNARTLSSMIQSTNVDAHLVVFVVIRFSANTISSICRINAISASSSSWTVFRSLAWTQMTSGQRESQTDRYWHRWMKEHSALVGRRFDEVLRTERETATWFSNNRANRCRHNEHFKEKNVDRSFVERLKTNSNPSDKTRAISASFSVVGLAMRQVSLFLLAPSPCLLDSDRLEERVIQSTSYLSWKQYDTLTVYFVSEIVNQRPLCINVTFIRFSILSWKAKSPVKHARTDKYKQIEIITGFAEDRLVGWSSDRWHLFDELQRRLRRRRRR